jgi:hypothetical protein
MGMAQISLARKYDRYMIKNDLVAEMKCVKNVRALTYRTLPAEAGNIHSTNLLGKWYRRSHTQRSVYLVATSH